MTPSVFPAPPVDRPDVEVPGERSIPRRAVLGALLAGLVAAEVVPLDRPGLGWLLAGLAGLGAVLATTRRAAWSAGRIASAVAVVLLLGAGTVRAAGWLFVLCVLVALPFASLAVAGGGGTWGRLARGATALPFAVPAAVTRTVHSGVVPRRGRQLATGTIAGLILVAVFATLFAGANPAFAQLLTDAADALSPAGVLLFVLAGCLTLAAAHLRTAPPPAAGAPPAHRRMLARVEWVVPVALVDLVFGVFVWSEGVVLFGGHQYVLGPDGPTFAEYARSGFWQLTLVTVLSLGIVGVVAYRVHRSDGVLIRILVGTLGILTLVVVASALSRMSTYVQAYGYTRVRLLGFGAELSFGAVVVLLLVAGVRMRGRWLPGAVAGLVVTAVLALVAVNPDAVVARTVIGRYQQDGHLDGKYLSGLSEDAVPALDRLPDVERSCVLNAMHLPSTVDSWSAYNAGRSAARRLVRVRPPDRYEPGCPFVFQSGPWNPVFQSGPGDPVGG
ncbi:MAG: hypothetical protein AUG44_06735 [Actinobacteria bacterium 13_1_20CM_3_71_11]|nr:MAG: hypothetical protein AUG44_06735 [Actinobacteria bacterium 13_1_20CM_3_71_11]